MTNHHDRRKSGRVSFEHVYNEPDPREYFRALQHFDYQAPARAYPIFSRLVEKLREQIDREDLLVLDLCCSYGINAALLNHDVNLACMYARYCDSPEIALLSLHDLIKADKSFYDENRRSCIVRVVGLDIAHNAILYAQRVGLHWDGSSENLEEDEPSERLSGILSKVDLVIVTGGVDFLSERTFHRVLKHAAAGSGCWVASFPCRWVQYEQFASVFSRFDMQTETLEGCTFRQRRFVNEVEQSDVINELKRLGLSTEKYEQHGWYYASFYLSRPREHCQVPLNEFVSYRESDT